jgi:hypothetical protein
MPITYYKTGFLTAILHWNVAILGNVQQNSGVLVREINPDRWIYVKAITYSNHTRCRCLLFANLRAPISSSSPGLHLPRTHNRSKCETVGWDILPKTCSCGIYNVVGFGQTVTEALKVMLAEDDKLVQKFKEKIDYFGEFLVQDGEIEAARFMLILRGMLEHEV